MQYSSKMKSRCLPLLKKHYESHKSPLELFALGFAAYLAFTKPVKQAGGKYFGELNGIEYPIQDDMAETFYRRWKNGNANRVAEETLKDTAFWGFDLNQLSGFTASVQDKLNLILNSGMKDAVECVQTKKVTVAAV